METQREQVQPQQQELSGNLPAPAIEYSKFGPGLKSALEAASEYKDFSILVAIRSAHPLTNTEYNLITGTGVLLDDTRGTTTLAHITDESDIARLSQFDFVKHIKYLATEIEC